MHYAGKPKRVELRFPMPAVFQLIGSFLENRYRLHGDTLEETEEKI